MFKLTPNQVVALTWAVICLVFQHSASRVASFKRRRAAEDIEERIPYGRVLTSHIVWTKPSGKYLEQDDWGILLVLPKAGDVVAQLADETRGNPKILTQHGS